MGGRPRCLLAFQNDLHVLAPHYVDLWSLFWYQIFIRVFVKGGVKEIVQKVVMYPQLGYP